MLHDPIAVKVSTEHVFPVAQPSDPRLVAQIEELRAWVLGMINSNERAVFEIVVKIEELRKRVDELESVIRSSDERIRILYAGAINK